MSGHADNQQNKNHFNAMNHGEQPTPDDAMDLDTFEVDGTAPPNLSHDAHDEESAHPSEAERTQARQALLNAATQLAGLTQVNGEWVQTTHNFLARSQHGPAPSDPADPFIVRLQPDFVTTYAPWTNLFRGANNTLLPTHPVATIDPSLITRESGDGGVGAPSVDPAVIARYFRNGGLECPTAVPPIIIDAPDTPSAPTTPTPQPLPTITIPASPDTLTAYLSSRPQDSRMVIRAQSYAAHPHRIVHQPTDPGACEQCREKVVECVTVPGKKHCALCTSLGGWRQYYCSTADERMGAEDRERDGGVPR